MGKSDAKKTPKRKRGGEGEVPDSEPESAAAKNTQETPPKKSKSESGEQSDSGDGDKKPWNLKLCSWNVNGVRAWLGKDGLEYLKKEQPDVFAIQETKCSDKKLPPEIKSVDGYHSYFLAGDQEGYSGVALLTKIKPLDIKYGIGMEIHDTEGRVITAEFEKFYLVAVYVPNAGKGLVRLGYRMQWDKDFRAYLKELETKKPVVLCGDMNVAHQEIDLANPKTNKKNAGFTQEERDGFTALLDSGFVDSFRHLYPDKKGAYTFWTYMMNSRAKNVGWRLDYFILSEALRSNISDSLIHSQIMGSDHCPVVLLLNI
ncbi:exodeoxyribonuclease-like [Amblyomma americanum]|uniref:DNA repair nuclease/redox regulator APEX1 n=1 Tax=Amblyomma americanum TaxID=6943 RepID=A0AAQ4FJH7_AMBAM